MKQKTNLFFFETKVFLVKHSLVKKKETSLEREIWRNHIEKGKIWEEFTIKKTPNCEHEHCWKINKW